MFGLSAPVAGATSSTTGSQAASMRTDMIGMGSGGVMVQGARALCPCGLRKPYSIRGIPNSLVHLDLAGDTVQRTAFAWLPGGPGPVNFPAGATRGWIRAAATIDSGIGPPGPKAGRRPPQIRTSAIHASGSSGLWVRYILEWTMRAGISGKLRSIAWNFSQFGLLPRLRRTSHFCHNFATSYRSLESIRLFPVIPK